MIIAFENPDSNSDRLEPIEVAALFRESLDLLKKGELSRSGKIGASIPIYWIRLKPEDN
jgi:hypothetical protein